MFVIVCFFIVINLLFAGSFSIGISGAMVRYKPTIRTYRMAKEKDLDTTINIADYVEAKIDAKLSSALAGVVDVVKAEVRSLSDKHQDFVLFRQQAVWFVLSVWIMPQIHAAYKDHRFKNMIE